MPEIPGVLEHFPYLGIFILFILGSIGFPLPEDANLIFCGVMISSGIVKPVPALIVIYLAVLIADTIFYSLGRKYGRRIVTHRRFQRIMPPRRLSMIEERFNKKGVLFILLGRHIAGLRAEIILGAGVMRMPYLKFLAADAASSIFSISVMVSIGYAGAHSIQAVMKGVARIEHVAVLLAVIASVIFLIFRHCRARCEKRGRKTVRSS